MRKTIQEQTNDKMNTHFLDIILKNIKVEIKHPINKNSASYLVLKKTCIPLNVSLGYTAPIYLHSLLILARSLGNIGHLVVFKIVFDPRTDPRVNPLAFLLGISRPATYL